MADILKELGRPITSKGIPTTVPAPGELGNWEISTLRATNVLKYFIRKHNFPATSFGFGLRRHAADRQQRHRVGRMLNRRIEIHVDYDNETAGEPQ